MTPAVTSIGVAGIYRLFVLRWLDEPDTDTAKLEADWALRRSRAIEHSSKDATNGTILVGMLEPCSYSVLHRLVHSI